jgi:hypothetical protein
MSYLYLVINLMRSMIVQKQRGGKTFVRECSYIEHK